MPASGGDPVTAALRLSLTATQGPEDISFDKRLECSTARVLLTQIEFEPIGDSLANVISDLKNKYTVLNSQDSAKNGDTSSTSNVPGRVLVTLVRM
jgi:hypothetical protein